MWSEHRSLVLSKLCTLAALVALVAVVVTAPWQVNWLLRISSSAQNQHRGFFLATIYVGGALAAFLLYQLYRLLHTIGLGEVFSPGNVRRLRLISWSCFLGGVLALASGLYFLPWYFVGFAACFVGLVVRVVKNVMAEAVLLKNENDYTI